MPEFMTITEVAQLLRSTERSVYEWLRTGKLGGVRAGWRWLITREDVDVFLKKSRENNGKRLVQKGILSNFPVSSSPVPGLAGSPSPASGPGPVAAALIVTRPNANPLAGMHRNNKRGR
jgi:excisionase family DNA binding protein